MNLSKTIILFTSTIFLTSCTLSPIYQNSKDFTFDNKEIELKLVYSCQDKPNLEAISIRAKKANEYFNKANSNNTEILIKDISEGKSRDTAAINFQKRSENIAIDLNKKFACTLIDTIDY